MLADAHDWPPEVINRLTLYQLRMLTCDETDLTWDAKRAPRKFRGFDSSKNKTVPRAEYDGKINEYRRKHRERGTPGIPPDKKNPS